jgi:NAD(P)-dependent dehydrogenase (short-subunit alcohol dehydrogenase family)
LVTGASAGLGVETCRTLAAHGAEVIGAVRDLNKGLGATEIVKTEAKNGFDLVQLDLASLASVRACADALVKAGKAFDVVIANAGVMACPKGKTADGFETQFGTNHLGHFVFINRLAPLLKSGARVVSLSSTGHRLSDVDLDDPNFDHSAYTEFGAYGRSKTANILFAVGLDKRLKGRGVRATAVHPGVIQTELGRHLTPEVIAQMRRPSPGASTAPTLNMAAMTYKTIPQGAATSVWSGSVAGGDEVGGLYCEDCHVAEVADDPQSRGGVRSYALDPARADALWAKSEQMVGETFRYS